MRILLILLMLNTSLLINQTYRTYNASTIHLKSDLDSTYEYVIAAPIGLSSSYTFKLPPTVGDSADVLVNLGDGSYTWSSPSNVTISPAGSNTNIQFSLSEAFNASSSFTWDNSNERLFVGTGSGSFNLNVRDYAFVGTQSNSGYLSLHSGNALGYRTVFVPSSNMTTSTTLTLPENDGTSGQFLITDGNGNLSWTSGAVGGSFPCEGQGTGGGTGNVATGDDSFVGGGTSNSADGDGAVIGGGANNSNDGTNSAIANGVNNEIETGSDNAFIGSGSNNEISGNSDQATIGSGSSNIIRSTGTNSTIGTGSSNIILSPNSIILTGTSNTIGEAADNSMMGTGKNNLIQNGLRNGILNGEDNTIESNADNSVIMGGKDNNIVNDNSIITSGNNNYVSGLNSAIAGGINNYVSGNYSAVLGGASNTVTGAYSGAFGLQSAATADYTLALGRRAVADDQGSMVFADSTDATLNSSATNRLEMRFTGGYRLFTNSGLSTGMTLAAGDNSWASVSDKNLKTNILDLDYKIIMDKLSNLEISTWNYIFSNDNKRNYGPMAQDFYKLFGKDDLGEFGNDKEIISNHITNVGLAGLKGLMIKYNETNQKLKDLQDDQNEILNEIDEMILEIEELETKLGEIK